jgi:hypothetical protein
VIHVELDVLALVIDADESVKPPSLECGGKLLADDAFEILVFAGYFDVNIQIPVIHTLDLDKHGQVGCFGSTGAEARHAVNHELTS